MQQEMYVYSVKQYICMLIVHKNTWMYTVQIGPLNYMAFIMISPARHQSLTLSASPAMSLLMCTISNMERDGSTRTTDVSRSFQSSMVTVTEERHVILCNLEAINGEPITAIMQTFSPLHELSWSCTIVMNMTICHYKPLK